MKRNSEFHDYVLHDVLGHIEGITSKAMFGGYGFYLDGTVFGIIAEGALYFKVDKAHRAEYEKLGCTPFTYTRGDGKIVAMSYYSVPEEVMHDRERILGWVHTSVNISHTK